MVGKIHKKKISEYTEAAENDDKQSDRGDEADEMILDHVEPVPSGSESENGDNANNEHNKSSDSVNANDDAGVSDDAPTGLNYDTDYNSAAEADGDEGKKAKKRKASKKTTDVESDDEPLNGGSPKKKRSKSGGKAKGNVKGKAKAKKASHKDDDGEDDDEGDDGEEEEYEVKDIVGHKTERGVSYFLIRWKGYTKADDTWEPEETLSCPEIIERYKKKVSLHFCVNSLCVYVCVHNFYFKKGWCG